jgi:predicted transcriptional regulator
MSGRAAWRLETLGFAEVYRYHPGKVDWVAGGLPSEGRLAHQPRIEDIAHQGVPTCQIGETLRAARARLEDTGFELCAVVNDQRVVLGAITRKMLDKGTPDTPVEHVMVTAPSTYRPNVSVDEMAQHMADTDRHVVLVTTADGVLVGLIRREEVERAAAA